MFVFDASTLILLAKIELLDLFLSEIGMEVAIPQAVHEECCEGRKTPDSLIIKQAVDESRITVRNAKDRKLAAKLQSDFIMGRGESEAIALAIERKALLVGIDDKHGINACKLTGVAFTTAMGILIRTRQKGLLQAGDAQACFSALTSFGRYKKSILEEAKRQLEEIR